MNKIKVGIIGGTGYTGVELLRLLTWHPSVEIVLVTSRTEAGRAVADCFASLRGHTDLIFLDPDQVDYQVCDVVFCATPNGFAMRLARDLINNGIRLIDLAADFRFKDVAVWEQTYTQKHQCPELLGSAVYGLPELNRKQIATAQLIANPGCYPTATILGFMPLIRAGLIDVSNLIADVKSGVSGAGRNVTTANSFSEVSDSFKAYGVAGHRHLPEINAILATLTKQTPNLTFVPHLVPMLRGIHATLYADLLAPETTLETVHRLFESTYAHEGFVDVMPLGSHPDTRSVRSSNVCRLAIHRASGTGKLVILSVIDNLTKGAAGQAVQNMNIMFGKAEQLGLQSPALIP